MSKNTTTSSKDGRITGKQVTERHGNGASTKVNYKAASRDIFGPNYKATSKTHTDSKGNSKTKTYK